MPDISNDEVWTVLLASAASALKLGDCQKAIQLYSGYIERDANRAEAFFKRAVALTTIGFLDLALVDYDRAIALNSRYGYAFCNRGSVLERLGRMEDAVRSFDVALSIDPADSLALYNRGTVLKQLGRASDALASFDQAIRLSPDYAEAYVNRGNILQEMWRHEDALLSFDKAIQLKPVFAEAFQGRGTSLQELKRPEDAIENFGQALALNPHQKYVAGMRRQLQMHICDWQDFHTDVHRLVLAVQEGIPLCSPFAMLTLTDSLVVQRLTAELYVRSECSSNNELGPIAQRERGNRIRIGYFSADFRDHPVAHLTAELFEQRDRDRFEATAFAFGPPAYDAVRKRLQGCFDRFVDVRSQSDLEVASLARQMQIDIAVDLGGLTAHSRTNIFALRAAPIQINFLGYPGTMGAEFIDYMIADRTVVPQSHQSHYLEKIIYLPDFYLPTDSTRPPQPNPLSRSQLGLPESAFVFCCFNNLGKLMPDTFESWMRILRQVDGSVLWLPLSSSVAKKNLRCEAACRGISPERLIFAARSNSIAEHRARLGRADLFLDTAPYNAHATALDALWAGLPILTLIGETFAGRVAASLLTAIGLPELIATTQKQYEELAVALAEDPIRMSAVRARMLHNRETTRGFEIRRFAANLEAAYSKVFDRYLLGQRPANVYLE